MQDSDSAGDSTVDSGASSDRRREPRFHLPDETVVWQRFQIQLNLGRLHDISRSGASFLADAESEPWNLPEIGEEIRVRHAGMKRRHSYEVVRLERVDGESALIGCRKIHPKAGQPERAPNGDYSAYAAEDNLSNLAADGAAVQAIVTPAG